MGLDFIIRPQLTFVPSQGSPSPGETLLVFLSSLLIILLLFYGRSSFLSLTFRRWVATLALMLLCGILNLTPLVKIRPSPSLPVPFLAPVPIMLAALLGIWPATLTALAGGLAGFLVSHHFLLYMFQEALFGALLGWFMTLDYTDEIPCLLRRPQVAAPVASILAWPRPFYTLLASVPFYHLCGGWVLPLLEAGIALVPMFLEGLLIRLAGLQRPAPLQVSKTSPLARYITIRLSTYIVVFLSAASLVLIFTVSSLTTQIQMNITLDDMEQEAQTIAILTEAFLSDATSAAGSLAFELDREPPARWPDILPAACSRSKIAQACLVATADGMVLASSPPLLSFTEEERQFLNSPVAPGGVVLSDVYLLNGEPLMAALTRLADGYRLILRIPLGKGPLASQFSVYEDAYLLDRFNRVLLPMAAPPLSALSLSLEEARLIQGRKAPSYSLSLDKSGWLVVRRTLPLGWWALLATPYDTVIGRVHSILIPFSLLLLIVVVALTALVVSAASDLARPLEELSLKAQRLARGYLNESFDLAGEDEVGRLARALERMRLTLKNRLDESYSLLRISQKALSVFDLKKSMRIFLEGLRDLMKASGAGLALIDKSGYTSNYISVGKVWEEQIGNALTPQSRLLAISERPLVVDTLKDAPAVLRNALQKVKARAAIGVPLTTAGRCKGVLWLTFDYPVQPTPPEMSMVVAIAGQLSVMAENLDLLKEAQRERLRLETILNSSPDPVLVVDELGRLVNINPAAEDKLGIKPEESLGLPLSEVLRDQNWLDFIEQMKKGTGSVQGEITTPEGVSFHLWASPLIEKGAEGTPSPEGWVIALRDITAFKETERARTEALEIVFHDLRSPLSLVQDYARTLRRMGTLNREQEEIVRKMLRTTEHLSRLVGNFLDISRLESGLMKFGPCWLRPILEEALNEVRDMAREKSISLVTELPADPCPFYGDRDFVKRAIVNLLDNAIKYTPRGGQVTVSVEDAHRFWVLKVQDTGVGIPVAEQQRIFEKFYRVKAREIINIRGSGLGLALVKSVAERHRGRVWVESEPGKGSTFFFAIPKAHRPIREEQG